MKTKQKQQGFTLIEFLLYMALLSILLMTFTEVFIATLEVKTEAEAVSAVEQDGRFLLARLSYDINNASAVNSPASLGSTSSNLSLTINSENYSYTLNNGKLQLTNSFGTNDLNSSETNITGISFQKIGNASGKETVKVNFTIESVAIRNSGTESRTFNFTVSRR